MRSRRNLRGTEAIKSESNRVLERSQMVREEVREYERARTCGNLKLRAKIVFHVPKGSITYKFLERGHL